MTGGSFLALLTPLVLKWLIDQVLPRRETGLLLCAAGLIFLSYQGRTALTSVGNYLTLTAVQKMALRLRMDTLRHLDELSADYYENTPPGAVMYPLKEPIEEVAYFGSDLLPSILRMCLTTTFTVVTMFVLSPDSFSLIRFETDGLALWFKAVGEPNQKEFGITCTA
jgi:ABC-type bacteriocin/lantibiotic exporter with double-glycine peptidase domain